VQCGAADVSGSNACGSSDCHTGIEVFSIILPEVLYDSVQQKGLSCDHIIKIECMVVDVQSTYDAGMGMRFPPRQGE